MCRDARMHTWRVAFAAVMVGLACANRTAQGHESPFYPSFYPQEIRIETIDAAAAAGGWPKALVHAYVGGDPFGGGTAPADAAPIESLHTFVVLTFDPSAGRAPAASDAPTRCAAARNIVRSLSPGVTGFVRYPYPVTPYHADYLEQFDLARRAQYAASAPGTATDQSLKIRADGRLAETLVSAEMKADATRWDATLEEIDLGQLAATETGGWVAPPWIKQGWFQAHLLYKGHVSRSAAAASDAAYRKLIAGDYRSPAERINLARLLVSTVVADCERVIVGYTVRREYFNADYSVGVENVAFDAQSGFLSRIFPRSVKLKDFPWNGWLRLGTPARPTAAWNPIGGFTDPFGQLLWLSISDPALLPDPYGDSWVANRVSVAPTSRTGEVSIPKDAVRPEAGTGRLRAVGAGKTAQQVLRYSVVTSAFHDGTTMGVADILYPYVFAYRWSAAGPGSGAAFDAAIARATALMREWLAGVKVISVTTQTRDFGSDLQFSYRVPIVDVYLNHRSSDPWEAAAIAPPWSTLPWEVLVLMEEAVQRGIAAFSPDEAQRRGVPWLDLARDRATGERLAALVDEFRDQAYRPAVLKERVTAMDARARWTALRAYYTQHGHFLVTNGPYRLDSWSAHGAVLQVFRDLSYPQGVGSFDAYAIPRKAYVASIDDRGDRIEIGADVEQVARFQRSYEITRAPFKPAPDETRDADRPQCRYVVIGPDGSVVRTGTAPLAGSGRFVLDLHDLAEPGTYAVMAAMSTAHNRMNPEVKMIEHRVAGNHSARQTPVTRLSMPAAPR